MSILQPHGAKRPGPPAARDGIRATRTSPRPALRSARFPNGLHTFSWQVDRALFDEFAKAATAAERSVAGLLRIVVRQYLEDCAKGPESAVVRSSANLIGGPDDSV